MNGIKRGVWRRDVWAWCSYDWANSGYTTLLITVFAIYIQRVVFGDADDDRTGPLVWAWAVSISMLIGAVLSPLVGAWADARRAKRLGLTLCVVVGSAACFGMALFPPGSAWWVVGMLVLANLSLEISLTLYNGFLPEIANEEELNRVSAWGMGWGYLGGGLGLLLAVVLLQWGPGWWNASSETLLRCCLAGTGTWWLLFSLPSLLLLRDLPATASPAQTGERGTAWRELAHTFRQIRRYRTLFLFLLAFLFFNDGVQTVISQASTFALQDLNFGDSELVGLILMVQFVATPGAIGVGWLSDRVGRKRTLLGCLAVWIGLLASAWWIESQAAFWWMAVGIALVLGGTQAVSRSIMGSLTPAGESAKFFGFFNLSGKATSFMGTFLFGLVIWWTGSARLAIVNLLIFFLIGALIVAFLPLDRPVDSNAAGDSMSSDNLARN